MPPLSGRQSIRDFTACVGYGMVNEIIRGDEGTKLLYAAQVAYKSYRKLNKSRQLSQKQGDPPPAFPFFAFASRKENFRETA